MELRWTQEAAADFERIADYLFEYTSDRAEPLVRGAVPGAQQSVDVPKPRFPVIEDRGEASPSKTRGASSATLQGCRSID